MRILVKILRGLLGAFVLFYVVLGLGVGSYAVDGPPPGGFGPVWTWLVPLGFWLIVIACYFGARPPERERTTIVVVALPLAFVAGVLFGTAPTFWGEVLRPLAARWVR